MVFKGSGVALATPFTENGIAFDTLAKLIDFQLENQTDAVVVCGTTGEPATMPKEEQNAVISFVVKRIDGKIPVIAGIGGNHTAQVVKSAKTAQDLGADALLAVTPYYNKCTDDGLLSHFGAIADATDLPVILYNVPSRTGVNISPAVYEQLVLHDRVAGIKEASGNLSQIIETARVIGDNAALYSGNDDQVVPLLSLGGAGVISVLANIMPAYTHELVHSYLEGDTKKALQMQLHVNPLIDALFSEVSPIPVKTALRALGFEMGPLRLPLTEMRKDHYELLMTQLRNFDLID